MLTDVQTPFFGTPVVPSRGLSPLSTCGAIELLQRHMQTCSDDHQKSSWSPHQRFEACLRATLSDLALMRSGPFRSLRARTTLSEKLSGNPKLHRASEGSTLAPSCGQGRRAPKHTRLLRSALSPHGPIVYPGPGGCTLQAAGRRGGGPGSGPGSGPTSRPERFARRPACKTLWCRRQSVLVHGSPALGPPRVSGQSQQPEDRI